MAFRIRQALSAGSPSDGLRNFQRVFSKLYQESMEADWFDFFGGYGEGCNVLMLLQEMRLTFACYVEANEKYLDAKNRKGCRKLMQAFDQIIRHLSVSKETQAWSQNRGNIMDKIKELNSALDAIIRFRGKFRINLSKCDYSRIGIQIDCLWPKHWSSSVSSKDN